MGNFFDKIKNMTNTSAEDEYYDDYENDNYDDFDDDYDDFEEEKVTSINSYSSPKPVYNNTNNVVNLKANVQMGMVIIHPKVYEDARSIADHIKSYRPVIINLDSVEKELAQRIMDFVSGTCYTLRGDLQRVSGNIFIIAPENVEITGDIREELKTRGINLPWNAADE